MIGRVPRPQPETPAFAPGHASRCLFFNGSDTPKKIENAEEISDLLRNDDAFVWFDIAEPTANDLFLLQNEFALHPMAIEDAALSHERPKIEAFDGYWLVVLQPATLDDDGRPQLHEIALIAGKNFLVTIRATPLYPLEEIERRWSARGEVPHDATGLLYVILDVIVDGYGAVVSSYDTQVEQLEERALDEAERSGGVLRDVLALKRELTRFRHAVAPVREILTPVLRGDFTELTPSLAAYYRDVHDHAARAVEIIDSVRDLLNSALDIHLSSQSQRQAEVSKQLTVIATVFLPLTYVTGFFGQNFGWMVNHIQSLSTFWIIGVGSQIAAIVILLAYFRRKRWT